MNMNECELDQLVFAYEHMIRGKVVQESSLQLLHREWRESVTNLGVVHHVRVYNVGCSTTYCEFTQNFAFTRVFDLLKTTLKKHEEPSGLSDNCLNSEVSSLLLCMPHTATVWRQMYSFFLAAFLFIYSHCLLLS